MLPPLTTGHGRSGEREVPEAPLLCLQALYALVAQYLDQGLLSYEMKDKVMADWAGYKDWNNFNEMARVINFFVRKLNATVLATTGRMIPHRHSNFESKG